MDYKQVKVEMKTKKLVSGHRCSEGSYLMRQQLVNRLGRHAGCLQLLAGLGGSLTLHQGLSLGQEVGHQDLRGRQGELQLPLIIVPAELPITSR